MKKKCLYVMLIFALVMSVALPVLAEADIKPGGPWITGTQEVKLEGFHNYEQLVRRLNQIEQSSGGGVELEVIGQSNLGRDIFMAKAGSGDKAVLIFTQQHGNEPHGTEAALNLLQDLGSSGRPEFRQIREELTVYIVPRLNPDGAEPDVFWRFNIDPAAPPRNISEGFWTSAWGGGWDINRYHWTDWTKSDLYANHPDTYPENPVPEAQAMVDAFLRVQPIWIIDVHNQGSFKSPDGKSVTSSIMWPNHPDVSEEAVNLSKQLCVAMMDQMNQYGYAEVTRYPGSAIPNIARNAYGLEGVGSVLIEIRAIGQKSIGMLNKHTYEQLYVMLEKTADGSLFELDPNRIDAELPERGRSYRKVLPAEEAQDYVE